MTGRSAATLILGAGPGGTGPLVHAAQHGLLERWLDRGITLVDRRTTASSALSRYALRADSYGAAFLEATEVEAPHRRLQERVQPGLAHQGAAAGDDLGLPRVPGIEEIARQARPHEIPARRQLAGEAAKGVGERAGLYSNGHRKSRSRPGAKGLRTEPARISNEA